MKYHCGICSCMQFEFDLVYFNQILITNLKFTLFFLKPYYKETFAHLLENNLRTPCQRSKPWKAVNDDFQSTGTKRVSNYWQWIIQYYQILFPQHATLDGTCHTMSDSNNWLLHCQELGSSRQAISHNYSVISNKNVI